MNLILEYWKNYITESKEGPFYVAKRDKKNQRQDSLCYYASPKRNLCAVKYV